MPPRQLHVQVVCPKDSGIAKDAIVNNFSFQIADGVGDADWTIAITTRLREFYTSFGARMGGTLNWPGSKLKIYDRADPVPRVPVYDGTFGMGDFAPPAQLPDEVALCLSFHGQFASGIKSARRRGRVFLGPWAASQVEPTGGTNGRPLAALVDAVKAAADTLMGYNDDLIGGVANGVQWGVRTDQDDLTAPVVGGWVDNSWDTQRRRGLAPSFKTGFGTDA